MYSGSDNPCFLHTVQALGAVISPPDVVLSSQVVRAYRAAAVIRVELRAHLPLLQLLQQRTEESPRRVQLVAADDEAPLSLNGVQ